MKAFRFLVHSNIWIALGASSLAWVVFFFTSSNPDYKFLGFLFCSTLFSYNLQRISRIERIKLSSPNSWVVTHQKTVVFLLIFSFLGSIVLFPKIELKLLLWLVLLGIVSGGYSLKNFRDTPYLKIIMIAASWGIACGIIPLIIDDNQPISLYLFSFGWIFCYIMAITIPFDIRDLEIDEKKKKTIPQWVGIKNAKLISYLFLCIAIALIGANLSFMPFLIMTVSFITAGMLVYFSSPTNHDYYFSFLIDGHIILQFLLVYFFC